MQTHPDRPRARKLHRGSHLTDRRRWAWRLSLLLAAAAATGCKPALVGSGVSLTESRDVGQFTRLSVAGAMRVDVRIVPGAETEVVLTGDDNVLPEIAAEVVQGQLRFRPKVRGWIQTKTPLTARITCSELTGLDVSGACQADIQGVQGTTFEVDASGACRVTAGGEATGVSVDASGACSVDLSQLAAQTAAVDASGACTVRIRASESLAGDASGACTVVLLGPCEQARVETSGASKLKRAETAEAGEGGTQSAEPGPAEAEAPPEEEGPAAPTVEDTQ